MAYKEFIADNFKIVNKEGIGVDFILNKVQEKYLLEDSTDRDIILKARQQGFSSLSLARFTTDFLVKENSVNVVVADNADNAIALLDRVKYFLKSYEEKNQIKIPLKYNSKYEIFNEEANARYSIGTAENTEFGRSRTIKNLLLSEAAFYQHFEKILAGALQAVVPEGKVVIETTANGFKYFKNFWDASKRGETTFKPLFYKASDFYSKEFLEKKKQELKELYPQEYPETDLEAFISSGSKYFDTLSLQKYLEEVNVYQIPKITT
jgi:hypothetical protein